MVWWQEILINLSRGVAWCLPIIAFFLGAKHVINWLLKEEPVRDALKKEPVNE